jgi:holo-[acyl-carrier protein] synthase
VIVAVGIDLCEVGRLRRALAGQAGTRFRQRVFTTGEQVYCDARGRGRIASYAARFAVKEAVAKALGTGFRDGVAWCDVEVVRDGERAPELALHGEAARMAECLGIARWHLSLTHTATMAAAVVVAEAEAVSRARRPGPAGVAAPRPASRPRPRRPR